MFRKSQCDCLVSLPHTPEQISARARRVMPRCICTPNPLYETEGVVAMETKKYVKTLGEEVDMACNQTDRLRKRVDELEIQFEEAQKTGVVLHADDCVYSNRFSESLDPRPPTPPDTDKQTIESLQKKLKISNEQHVVLRNVIVKQRSLLGQCKLLLAKELGIGCSNLKSLGELMRSGDLLGWKSRTQTIRNLRTRIVHLESKLREIQTLYRHDVDKDAYNPEFHVDTDYAVPPYQRQVLNKLSANKTDVIRDKDQLIEHLHHACEELEILYKSAKSRNKTLEQELGNQREKVKTLTEKANSDEELITTLMKHQNLMRDMLEQQATSRNREFQREQDAIEMLSGSKFYPKIEEPERESLEVGIEWEKYKTLYIMSENKSQSLENMVIDLQNRLDLVNFQVVEAEKHCVDHQCRLLALSKQFEELKRTGKIFARGKLPIKLSTKEAIATERLKTLRHENDMLRNFLKDTVFNKTEDFQLYKASLEAAKKGYLISLQKIQETLKAKEDEEEEDQETEEQ